LKGQDAQDLGNIIGGDKTTTPTNPNEKKKWEIKVEKTMYVLSVTMEDEFLHRSKIVRRQMKLGVF